MMPFASLPPSRRSCQDCHSSSESPSGCAAADRSPGGRLPPSLLLPSWSQPLSPSGLLSCSFLSGPPASSAKLHFAKQLGDLWGKKKMQGRSRESAIAAATLGIKSRTLRLAGLLGPRGIWLLPPFSCFSFCFLLFPDTLCRSPQPCSGLAPGRGRSFALARLSCLVRDPALLTTPSEVALFTNYVVALALPAAAFAL